MPDYGAYDTGTIEAEANIVHGSAPCTGGFADWKITGSSCLLTSIGGTPEASLKNFSVDFPESYWPERVKVRIKGSAAGNQTLSCQLRYDGSLVGIAKTKAITTGAYDVTFDQQLNKEDAGWQAVLSRAQLMNPLFGITMGWPVVFIDTIDGISVTIEAGPGWDKVEVYAEPAFKDINAGAESAFNTSDEYAESAFRSINEQAAGT